LYISFSKNQDTLKVLLPLTWADFQPQSLRLGLLTENLKLLPLSNFTLANSHLKVKNFFQYLF